MKIKTHNKLDTAKSVLKGNFTAINIYIKKAKRFEINNIMMHTNNE